MFVWQSWHLAHSATFIIVQQSMDPLKKTLTSRTLRRGAPLIVQKQWGGEGGSGLQEDLIGLLHVPGPHAVKHQAEHHLGGPECME